MRSTRFAVVALCLALTGCGGTSDHYAASTAQSLERRVLSIAKSASGGDYASALQQLSQLQTADDQALADGNLTTARHDAIAASIVAVRADLLSLQAQQQARLRPVKPGHGGGDGGKGNGQGDGKGGGD